MSAQAQLMAARVCTPSASAPTQPGVYGSGSGSNPQITLSASAPAPGRPTTGFMCLLVGTSVTTLTVHFRDPHTLLWGELASFSSTDDEPLAVFKWITLCGVNACELYFETDAADATSGGVGPAVLVIEQAGG